MCQSQQVEAAKAYLYQLQALAASFGHSDPIPLTNQARFSLPDFKLPEHLALSFPELGQANIEAAYGPEMAEWFKRDPSGPADPSLEMLESYAKQIHDSYARLRCSFGDSVPPFPVVGILPLGTIDAIALRVPETKDQSLIVVNRGVFSFLYVLAKVFVLCASIPPVPQGDGLFYRFPGIARNRFREMFKAYLLKGKPEATHQWLLEAKLLPDLDTVITAAEIFLVSHEVAHVLFGHLDSDRSEIRSYFGYGVTPLQQNVKDERDADLHASEVTQVILRDRNPIHVNVGIEIAIVSRYLIDCARELFNNEEVQSNPVSKNPRGIELDKSLRDTFGPHVDPFSKMNQHVRFVFDYFWEDFKPRMLEIKEKGGTLANIWSPV